MPDQEKEQAQKELDRIWESNNRMNCFLWIVEHPDQSTLAIAGMKAFQTKGA